MSDIFNPADPACWVGRGRSTAHAEAIAHAWRRFLDTADQLRRNDNALDSRDAAKNDAVTNYSSNAE